MKDTDIVIVPIGGLANRMRAIASAFVLASKIGYDLRVMWYPNKECNVPFETIFNIKTFPLGISTPNFLIWNLLYEIPRKKNLYVSYLINKLVGRKQFIIDQDIDSEILEKTLASQKKCVISSGLELANIDHAIIKSLFSPTPIVEETKRNILKNIHPNIGIHIRRTDNVLSIENSPLSVFEKKIEEVLSISPSSVIYLASDDEETKHYLLKKFPKNIITNPRKADRQSKEGLIDAFAEMLILSECDQIYGSFWSSYSEMTAMLGNKKLEILRS